MFALSIYFLGRTFLNLGRKLSAINNEAGLDCIFNQRSLGGALFGAISGLYITILAAPDLVHGVYSPIDGAAVTCAVMGYTLGLIFPSPQARRYTIPYPMDAA